MLKFIAFTLFLVPSVSLSNGIGDMKVGMTNTEAAAIGIHHCEPTKERLGKSTIFFEGTLCRFSLDGALPPKKGHNVVIFDNKTKRIVVIKAFIFSSSFKESKPLNGTSYEELKKYADKQLLKDYNISPCPRVYYPVPGSGLSGVCLFAPNVVRVMENPVMTGKRGGVGLATAIDVSVYSYKPEHDSVLKNTVAVEKKMKAARSYADKQKQIAEQIMSGK